jgi:5'-3' exonuclease
MIIFDFNQVVIANLMEQIGSSKTPVEESLVRHMVLNTIRANVRKFREYGEVVIACDSKSYWRREVFPPYKGSRKKNRDASGHDWASIFECMSKIREELKVNSPYKVIEIYGAEADDIIGVLTQTYGQREKIMILSSDKDFVQLQTNTNVLQYSPSMKKNIKTEDAEKQLLELIIRGDSGDGVPNVLSPDNCLIEGVRQKPITEKAMNNIMEQVRGEMSESLKRNWSRNKQLIDLSCIPENLSKSIIDTYVEIKPANRQQFMNYMIANKLTNLLAVIDEF